MSFTMAVRPAGAVYSTIVPPRRGVSISPRCCVRTVTARAYGLELRVLPDHRSRPANVDVKYVAAAVANADSASCTGLVHGATTRRKICRSPDSVLAPDGPA